MTSSLERRSRGQHKRKTGDNKKKTPTPITSDSPSTSPSPDHAPFMPINPPNSYDSNASYRVQFDEELTKIDK